MEIEGRAHRSGIMTWVLLRKAMQSAGDNARKEVFDRIEGRPTLKIAGPTGGPIETITHDLKKLTSEKIRLIRTILAEAVVTELEFAVFNFLDFGSSV